MLRNMLKNKFIIIGVSIIIIAILITYIFYFHITNMSNVGNTSSISRRNISKDEFWEWVDPYKKITEEFDKLGLLDRQLSDEEVLEITYRFLERLGVERYNITYVYKSRGYPLSAYGHTINARGYINGSLVKVGLGIEHVQGKVFSFSITFLNASVCNVSLTNMSVIRERVLKDIIKYWRFLNYTNENIRPYIKEIELEKDGKISVTYGILVEDLPVIFYGEGFYSFNPCKTHLHIWIPYYVFIAYESGFFIRRQVLLSVDEAIDNIIKVLESEGEHVLKYKLLNQSFAWAPYFYAKPYIGGIFIYTYMLELELVCEYEDEIYTDTVVYYVDPQLGNIVFYAARPP